MDSVVEFYTFLGFLTMLASPFILIKSFKMYHDRKKEEQQKRRQDLEKAAIVARQKAKMDEQLFFEKLREEKEFARKKQERRLKELHDEKEREYYEQLKLDFCRKSDELKNTIDDPEEYERLYAELLNTHPFIGYRSSNHKSS